MGVTDIAISAFTASESWWLDEGISALPLVFGVSESEVGVGWSAEGLVISLLCMLSR